MLVRLNSLAALAVLCLVLAAGDASAQDRRVPTSRGRSAALLRPGGAAGRSGRGQRLRGEDRGQPQPAVRGPDLPPVLRYAGHERPGRAGAAFARLGRSGRSFRPRGHQQPRHRRGRPGEGLARRQARVRGRDRAEGFALRPCRAAHQGPGRREIRRARILRFGRIAGGRPGARDRQPLRRRPDRDPRHRFGVGAHPGGHHRLSVLHPDRRGDQSGQFRRRAGRSRRQARRYQHCDLLAVRRFAGHRLRHSGQHGARRRGVRARRRQRGEAAVARRAAAGGDAGDRRQPGTEAAGGRIGRDRLGAKSRGPRGPQDQRSDRLDRRPGGRRSQCLRLPLRHQGARRFCQDRAVPRRAGDDDRRRARIGAGNAARRDRDRFGVAVPGRQGLQSVARRWPTNCGSIRTRRAW